MPRILDDSLGGVGSYMTSDLTEVQFQNLHGPGWILADGRSVAGSKYATVKGVSAVPDARGQTLRGKNNGRTDASRDLEGERALGSSQLHATAMPAGANAFTVASGGAHTHGYTRYQSQLGGLGGAGAGWAADTTVQTTQGASAHTHGITGGDDETRMKNIAVNIFIRIN
jgi:hypothetical protein